jgi:Pilus formation protein N terminal region
MIRATMIAPVALFAFTTVFQVAAVNRALAAEPHVAEIQVISSDVTSRFVPLGLDKSVVINLPADAKDVLVANPKIVNAVVRSKRRVYLIGMQAGTTNVYFFDANGRQIGGLDIQVSSDEQLTPPILRNSSMAGTHITVYRGMDPVFYNCDHSACTIPTPTLPASTYNSISTFKNDKGNVTGTSVSKSSFTGQ